MDYYDECSSTETHFASNYTTERQAKHRIEFPMFPGVWMGTEKPTPSLIEHPGRRTAGGCTSLLMWSCKFLLICLQVLLMPALQSLHPCWLTAGENHSIPNIEQSLLLDSGRFHYEYRHVMADFSRLAQWMEKLANFNTNINTHLHKRDSFSFNLFDFVVIE